MWAWGGVERMAAGFLGAHGGDRWNTALAVGVTAAAGIALVAIIVSSRRSVDWYPRPTAPLKSLLLLRPVSDACCNAEAGSNRRGGSSGGGRRRLRPRSGADC